MTAELLRIHPDEPEPDLIRYVAKCLESGAVAALPTDTFYGLAVDPVNLRAVEQIYELKTRAKYKPLSLLIASVNHGYELARDVDSAFDRLAEKFWPGPLTIIVKAGSKLPLRVTAHTGNVALRVPEAPIARAVVEQLGLPITATSANLAGLPECTHARCVPRAAWRSNPADCGWRTDGAIGADNHRGFERRRRLLDDSAGRRDPHA